jgi:hypothetical protein
LLRFLRMNLKKKVSMKLIYILQSKDTWILHAGWPWWLNSVQRCLTFVGPQYGTCFISQFWCLEFWVLFLKNLCSSTCCQASFKVGGGHFQFSKYNTVKMALTSPFYISNYKVLCKWRVTWLFTIICSETTCAVGCSHASMTLLYQMNTQSLSKLFTQC